MLTPGLCSGVEHVPDDPVWLLDDHVEPKQYMAPKYSSSLGMGQIELLPRVDGANSLVP